MSTPENETSDPTVPFETQHPTTVLGQPRPDSTPDSTPDATPDTGSGARPFRMRTLVLGLVLLVVAGAVLLAQLTTLSVDPGVVVLGLMVVAGLMLIAGAARS